MLYGALYALLAKLRLMQKPFEISFCLEKPPGGDGIPLETRYLFFLGIGVRSYAGHQ